MPVIKRTGQIDGWVGMGLQRPECVLAHRSGLLFVPNWAASGGYSLIDPVGRTHHVLARSSRLILRPNGIALEDGGAVLIAHLGDRDGGIYRLHTDSGVEPVVTMAGGKPLPPTNFVVKDSNRRIWLTVSTRHLPRHIDYRRNANSGFIAVAEPGSNNATIVADGLGYANECVIDEENCCVFVNETFGRRLTRFELQTEPQVKLSEPQVICRFSKGSYPDGMALDNEGHLWVTSIVSNRIMRVSMDGRSETIFEDSAADHVNTVENAYEQDQLARVHLDKVQSSQARNFSNVAFAGPSLSTLYIGNLLGNSLPYINTQFKGTAMSHWNVTLGELEFYLQSN